MFDVEDGRFATREAFGDNTVGSLSAATGLDLIDRTDAAASPPGD